MFFRTAARLGIVLCLAALLIGQPGGFVSALGISAVPEPAALMYTPPLAYSVTAAAPGQYHTCALTSTGMVKCWGQNNHGQLGNGTTTDSPYPINVSNLSGLVSAVAVGNYHTCAVTQSGGVKCWGYNASGQLGDRSSSTRSMPVDVYGLTSGAVAVAAGGSHTCAITTSGGVKCWGFNSSGQLGNNTTNNSSVPVDVAGLHGMARALIAGASHTCALTAATEVAMGMVSRVECWGANTYGQLGDGSTTNRLTPVEVSGLTGGMVSTIAAGSNFNCALTYSGGVKCWGHNWSGGLGDGTTTNRSTPVDVTGLSGALGIGAGNGHACALTSDASGSVKCWGDNAYGQIGDGTTQRRTAPTAASGLGNEISNVLVGYRSTCAITKSGGLKCWGTNSTGQIGDGTQTNRLTPVNVEGAANWVSSIDGGTFHNCAILYGGVKCWGRNVDGQLGNGTNTGSSVPIDVQNLGGQAIAVAAGSSHTCAVVSPNLGATSGGVKCWGSNNIGQLGNNSTINSWTPVDVIGLSSGVIALSAGPDYNCALVADAPGSTTGGLKCWGMNNSGQLGNGSAIGALIPVDVTGLSSGVSMVTAGERHACAVHNGGVKCWGGNHAGQIGDGSFLDENTPVDVPGLTSGMLEVSAGFEHTCARTSGGGMFCWGGNNNGQLGNGVNIPHPFPMNVIGMESGVSMIAAGYSHTCALVATSTVNGGVRCWGGNNNGQLGNGTDLDSPLPVDVTGLTGGMSAVTVGGQTSCALTSGGGVLCWGYNHDGQLGNGDADAPSYSYTHVSGLPANAYTTLNVTMPEVEYGMPAIYTATVSGAERAPLGVVQFKLDGQNLGAPVPVTPDTGSSTAMIFAPAIGAGSHLIQAEFSGEWLSFFPGFSAGAVQVVTRARTTTDFILIYLPNPSDPGQPVTFIARLSSGSETPGAQDGTVAFLDNGTVISGCGAVVPSDETHHATCTTSTLASGEHVITAEYSGSSNFLPSSATTVQRVRTAPVITWADPADIVEGTALGSTQLNATANVPGTFVYTPETGTLLTVGTHTLRVDFTPYDTDTYLSATKTVQITVDPRPVMIDPVITWANPASILAGTPLGSAQLNATANVPGTFVYSPAAGTVLTPGTHTLRVVFTPADPDSYNTVEKAVTILVTSRVQFFLPVILH